MLAAAIAAVLVVAPAAARGDGGDGAMLSDYAVAPDRVAAFVDGYRRHIRWHLAARDPWPWYVWQVRSGPRRGHFVGASIDHAWSDLDRRPEPDADAADHRTQIDAHVASITPRHLIRRRDLGGSLPALESAPELVMIELRLATGARVAAESAARRLSALAGADARFAWFEVVIGTGPTLVLLVPVARPSDLGASALATVWRASPVRIRVSLARLEAAAASIESTLLGFRPDLSSCRAESSGCLGTVPATSR
jgi:hypothetical protein